MKLSLHSTVRFKPTARGRAVLAAGSKKLMAPPVVTERVIELQLWEFMQVFGASPDGAVKGNTIEVVTDDRN